MVVILSSNTNNIIPELYIKSDIENNIDDKISNVIITNDTFVEIPPVVVIIDNNCISDKFTENDKIRINNILFNKNFDKYKSGCKCNCETTIMVCVLSVIFVAVILIIV